MTRATMLLLLLAACLPACVCQMSLNACHEAALSGSVFIGTVESIEPSFLNQWNLTQRADLLRLNEEYARVKQNPSPASLAALKDAYVRTFPDLSEDRKRKLEAARNATELAGVFYGVLGDGKQIRFRVKESFKKEDEAKDEGAATMTVWTPFGDCGYDFQLGETYLVYADEDEETNVLSTGSCSRTRRLTDAGDDLAYLFFLKNAPERSARLEGFATTNELFQGEIDKQHDADQVKSPVPGVMIALESAGDRRYTKTGETGRFVFDGLAAGEYKLSAFGPEYPREVKLLAPARTVRVEAKACNTQTILLPK